MFWVPLPCNEKRSAINRQRQTILRWRQCRSSALSTASHTFYEFNFGGQPEIRFIIFPKHFFLFCFCFQHFLSKIFSFHFAYELNAKKRSRTNGRRREFNAIIFFIWEWLCKSCLFSSRNSFASFFRCRSIDQMFPIPCHAAISRRFFRFFFITSEWFKDIAIIFDEIKYEKSKMGKGKW